MRDDIVSLYSRQLPGFQGCALPCEIVGRIRPAEKAITLDDYLYAKQLAGGRPLKAHVTGPLTLARNSRVDPTSPYSSRNDPKLVLDLADAIGQEARACPSRR